MSKIEKNTLLRSANVLHNKYSLECSAKWPKSNLQNSKQIEIKYQRDNNWNGKYMRISCLGKYFGRTVQQFQRNQRPTKMAMFQPLESCTASFGLFLSQTFLLCKWNLSKNAFVRAFVSQAKALHINQKYIYTFIYTVALDNALLTKGS